MEDGRMKPSGLPARLGVFGGSFDPVHLGHLLAAQDAFEHAQLDRILFMPAALAPLKECSPALPAASRLALLRAAVADDPRFGVSTLELERGGTSYTIDTARALRELHPRAELFWIIGMDQATQLGAWRDISTLVRLVTFVVLARPGFVLPAAADLPAGARLQTVAVHEFTISSSEIRVRLAAGRPVRLFLPAPVADHIEREHLYRTTAHAHSA